MADSSEAAPDKSLQEYANERLDEATDVRYLFSPKADVDLTQPGYILRGMDGSWTDCRLQVLNITDEALTVIVVSLSYEHETVASIFAKRTPPDLAVMQLAVADAVARDSSVLYTVDRRSDFVQTCSVASEMLLILAKADGHTARVLDARYVGGNESFALAVLPEMLEESGEPFKVQPDKLTESIVEEVLDHMGGTRAPNIEVRVSFAGYMESTSDRGLRIDTRILDVPISNTIERLRLQVEHFMKDIQDMYVWHDGPLLEDEVTLSGLSVEKNGDLQMEGHAAATATVVSVYLLPGRKQGRLEHLANSAESGVDNAAPLISVSRVNPRTNRERVVLLQVDVLSTVRHVKERAIRAMFGQRRLKLHGNMLSDAVLKCCGSVWNDSTPADIYLAILAYPQHRVSLTFGCPRYNASADLLALEVLLVRDAEKVLLQARLPVWPWKTLLPLAEREFIEKDVNDFDVQTFSLYSSKIVLVNRTSAKVHMSCFPTWSRRRNIKSVEVSAETGVVKAGVTVEVETTIQHYQGYGAVQDPCLEGIGAFDIVNIPKGMAREMSVVVGVESTDGQSIGYKQLKNVRGGQQLDVLKSFLKKGSKYTHPVGQPSTDDLAANFLPRP